MTFPADLATVVIRAAFGADVTADPSTWTWTDITTYWVASEPVTVTDGRSEGATQAEASEATITLDATDCAMMPGDPRSPHHPHVALGTPMWMTVDAGAGAGAYNLVRGYISSITPEWPGRSRYLCWVRVTVRGILDRLGRGASALGSPISRAILASTPAPVAYWRLDDGRDSTAAASALPGGTPMTAAEDMAWATVDGPKGATNPLPELATDDTTLDETDALVATVSTSPSTWSVECVVCLTPGGDPGAQHIWYAGPTWSVGASEEWIIRLICLYSDSASANALEVSARYGTQDATYLVAQPVGVVDGHWHHVRVTGTVTSTTLTLTAHLDGTEVGTIAPTLTAPITTGIRRVHIPYLGEDTGASVSLGHLAVYSGTAPDHSAALDGYAGEPASTRILRLCQEEGVPVTIADGDSEPLGAQDSGTFLDLIRECEAADAGRLTEDGFGLRYRPRSTLYNQTPAFTLDGSAEEIADPFSPTLDIQRRRNEWTITRAGGSSATYVDTTDQTTAGRLDDSATINTATDGALVHHAQWRVGAGTTPGMRYPSLSCDLGRHPNLLTTWQTLAIGDRVQATSPPHQHVPEAIDQLVEGRSQTLSGRTGWTATMVTSPARPHTVWIVEATGTHGRLDTETSTLDTSVDDTQTTITVASTQDLWTTDATDLPIDLDVGGERVTVTDITGTSSPQTMTVTRGVDGVATTHPEGATVRQWHPAVIAL